MEEWLRWKNGQPSLYTCAGDMPPETAYVLHFCMQLEQKPDRKAEQDS